MTQREKDILKLERMYKNLYNIDYINIWTVESELTHYLDWVYKDKLEKKFLSVIEPFHNYVIKQVMMGDDTKFHISISTDVISKNPYLTIHKLYSDFTVPKSWSHIGIVYDAEGLGTYKLYIQSAKNISLDTTTDNVYDNVYALIYNIQHTEYVIVTKAVYIKIIRKIYEFLMLGQNCINKSLILPFKTQLRDLDDFLINYMIMYIPKHRPNFKLLEHQAHLLYQSWDKEDRTIFARLLLENSK